MVGLGRVGLVWGVFYKFVWFDLGVVSKGVQNCEEIEMIERVLIADIEKYCVQIQF